MTYVNRSVAVFSGMTILSPILYEKTRAVNLQILRSKIRQALAEQTKKYTSRLPSPFFKYTLADGNLTHSLILTSLERFI
ncbi:hypothetical protein Mp_7g19720 [Marchantia polymorpha subsp. ruderalis]|uniref:Uncharacterized protein n=2 Tax=Marchantia polymorpha TaxID=3197 RepID=A0AAF6C1J0_MARPO|nr:hypothetical protein MARPO_0067s0006 [Marchantia polymorpha]BBN18124.1 hypothetical protein Mp_7g19720 [Marchantia polymorpha subsp. ruderalis]|eukprot:PTQ35911.1 hypothetical protein MARPO_0067s0006 [Marchantia polymorpha]